MSTSSSRIDILVYFGGELSEDGWSVTYDRRPIAVMRIPRSSTYAQFLARIYQKIGADSNEYLLKVLLIPICAQMRNQMKKFPIPPENGPNDVDINVIAEEFARGQVKCNPTFAIKHVIQTVKDHTGYDIPYQKAWYSLKMAREIVYGTWESSVQKLPKYMGAVQKYNPGTIVEWKHKALHPTGAYVIGYVFWAFKPCIEGFKFCRNIISVDGTHLYTRYKHKMLIAATMDGNQQNVNGVLKGRRLPVTAIVEITLQRTAHYFRERALRSAVMLSNGQLWTDFAKKKFTDWGEKSITHTVTKYDHLQQSASVVTKRQQGLGFNTHVVKLANRECSCGKWNQFGIPCSHAQKVCAAYNINAANG
ncbi:UNVERIFIED_CONTAM: hypothetical protein Sradi_3473200 [Sesamum radiatum]|uniref:SWIM-type domain-containing protein n=1 Tax=Sesamum radiatum TaxID=300843 RepID=A0AAW2QDZ3_SESRA